MNINKYYSNQLLKTKNLIIIVVFHFFKPKLITRYSTIMQHHTYVYSTCDVMMLMMMMMVMMMMMMLDYIHRCDIITPTPMPDRQTSR